jgi:hypothetical protein
MKVDGRLKVQLHTFVTSQPIGGQHSASHPSDTTTPTVRTIFCIKKNSGHASYQTKGKGKAIPLQALTGPEGSRRLRLPDFKTIGT